MTKQDMLETIYERLLKEICRSMDCLSVTVTIQDEFDLLKEKEIIDFLTNNPEIIFPAKKYILDVQESSAFHSGQGRTWLDIFNEKPEKVKYFLIKLINYTTPSSRRLKHKIHHELNKKDFLCVRAENYWFTPLIEDTMIKYKLCRVRTEKMEKHEFDIIEDSDEARNYYKLLNY